MAQSQKPKTMKVEIMKSIPKWAFLNARFETHKQFSVFCCVQSCKSDLPLPESGVLETEESTVNSLSKRR